MRTQRILQEDVDRLAMKELVNKLNESNIQYTKEDLAKIGGKVLMRINTRLNEAFDETILDTVDEISPAEMVKLLKKMVGNVRQRKSPFAPIQAINLFFSDNGAIKHTVGARPIIQYLLKDDEVRKSLHTIKKSMDKIESMFINNKSDGAQFIYNFSYIVDDIVMAVRTLITTLNKNYSIDWFRGSEVIDGSADGRRKGLAQVLLDANMNMSRLQDTMKKFVKFAEKGKDPMRYWSR